MAQPVGFVDKDRPHHVCKLKKVLYGLKQTPRTRYTELKNYLLRLGFKNSLVDTSLFFLNDHGVILYVPIYMDDFFITGNSVSKVQDLIASLSQRFSLKDLGDLSYFLEMEY